ncbi:triose-phosphate isomerase [Hungatella sp.]|uniref:triose-phosphate isomerase n=1 Tax=Hungatella sp. TaxID=2613924 RepID=UPI002A802FDF|nr:triose-phosphate isomerase [Hungatella sp.]
MKKIYFGSNLKMYKTAADTVAYVKELFRLTEKLDRSQIGLFIIPSYTALMAVSDAVPHESIMIGAQNMYWEEKGQFTGEISPVMLEELKVNLVMIGHSERRHIFGETDFLTNQKVKAALRHGFTALLCVGETGEEKEYGISEEVLRRQLKIGFHGVGSEDAGKIIVAYEPVWSIGEKGIPASSEYAESMHRIIHQTLENIFGEKGTAIPVLYGGSVNRNNVDCLIRQHSVDGLFVGRAAWQAEAFASLIEEAVRVINTKITI